MVGLDGGGGRFQQLRRRFYVYRGGWVGEKRSPSPALGWFDRFLEVRVTDQ